MKIRKIIVICLIIFSARPGYSLEPDQILIIANSEVEASVQITRYYCAKRGVPPGNVLALPLGTGLSDTISRDDYEKQLAGPICKKLFSGEFANIRCLLTTYGVPIKVEGRGALKGQEKRLGQLKKLAERERGKLEKMEQIAAAGNKRVLAEQKKKSTRRLAQCIGGGRIS